MAFAEISIPIPVDDFNSFNIESNMQPDPVPISNILILLSLKKSNTLYINSSVSGLGISVEWLTIKSWLQNSLYPII